MHLAITWRGFGVTVIILALFAVLLYPVVKGSRDCEDDSECPVASYCGADFNCHQVPLVNGDVVYQFPVVNAIIIGGAVVLAALLLRQKLH